MSTTTTTHWASVWLWCHALDSFALVALPYDQRVARHRLSQRRSRRYDSISPPMNRNKRSCCTCRQMSWKLHPATTKFYKCRTYCAVVDGYLSIGGKGMSDHAGASIRDLLEGFDEI